jgi:hypothetical protein
MLQHEVPEAMDLGEKTKDDGK